MVDVDVMKKQTSYSRSQSQWWWMDSHQLHYSPTRSPWLQTTLSELDRKTKAMLKLVEEDADSFAQRAEMYYKKRPELITMVEEFYRSHRSLAEKYDQLKTDSGARLIATLGSPFSMKSRPCLFDQTSETHSEVYDHEDSTAESEVDDPEEEAQGPEQCQDKWVGEEIGKIKALSDIHNHELIMLRSEIERLREENRIQKEQLMQKDEEKREVIRQLSFAVEQLKQDNINLRRSIIAGEDSTKKKNHFEFGKLKDVFSGKFCNWSDKSRHFSIVAV